MTIWLRSCNFIFNGIVTSLSAFQNHLKVYSFFSLILLLCHILDLYFMPISNKNVQQTLHWQCTEVLLQVCPWQYAYPLDQLQSLEQFLQWHLHLEQPAWHKHCSLLSQVVCLLHEPFNNNTLKATDLFTWNVRFRVNSMCRLLMVVSLFTAMNN